MAVTVSRVHCGVACICHLCFRSPGYFLVVACRFIALASLCNMKREEGSHGRWELGIGVLHSKAKYMVDERMQNECRVNRANV